MNEAVQTTGSPGAILAIVIIMPILTMILIIAPAVADSWQARVNRPVRGVGPLGPALADVATHTGALGENTADADMTSADKTDAGAPAAGESAGAAAGMPREPVPAWRSGSPTGEVSR